MKPGYVDRVIWEHTIVTHIRKGGKMVPCAPKVVWSKVTIREYLS